MSNNKSRKILETSLALLLGFEVDDVVDVIDHLLTFDSKEDLLEHITALLGRNDNDVLTFVENIIKFQNGQDLDDGNGNNSGSVTSDSIDVSGTVGSDTQLNDSKNKSLEEAIEKQRQEEERIKRDHEERKRLEQRKKKQQQKQHRQMNGIKVKNNSTSKKKNSQQNQRLKSNASSTSSSVGSNSGTTSISTPVVVSKQQQSQPAKSAPTPDTNKTSSSSTKSNDTFQIVKPKIELPPKGKAKIICGCFGTIHPYVANCLHCGYILCQKEGYGYCPHCSNLVAETIISGNVDGNNNLDDGMIKAILHKERLLDFDRNSASRTKVYDSQSDYYSSSTSNWLTEEEQVEAALKEAERVKEIHSKKHVLALNIE